MLRSAIMGKDFVQDAIAGQAKVGAPRQVMGDGGKSFTNASGTDTGRTKLVKKGNSKGGSEPATANHRSPVMQERLGARYAIGVKLPGPTSPEAGQTQANGRIVPNVYGSDRRNFRGGSTD